MLRETLQLRPPWVQWKRNLPLLLPIALFAWTGWDTLSDATTPWPTRLGGGFFFAGLVALFGFLLWNELHWRKRGEADTESPENNVRHRTNREARSTVDPQPLSSVGR